MQNIKLNQVLIIDVRNRRKSDKHQLHDKDIQNTKQRMW